MYVHSEKNEVRLDAAAQLMNGEADRSVDLSTAERRWLEDMIQRARQGDWKWSATAARRMMEDQVDY